MYIKLSHASSGVCAQALAKAHKHGAAVRVIWDIVQIVHISYLSALAVEYPSDIGFLPAAHSPAIE